MSETVEKVECGVDARRRVLNLAVSTVLLETGFDSADKMSLETLTEMLQCCMFSYYIFYCFVLTTFSSKSFLFQFHLIATIIFSQLFSFYWTWQLSKRILWTIGKSWTSAKWYCYGFDEYGYDLTFFNSHWCLLNKFYSLLTSLYLAGISIQGIEQYAARPNRHVIQPPQQATAPRTPAMLSAGAKAKPAPHIPFHLPPLPDPHAYIRTPVRLLC